MQISTFIGFSNASESTLRTAYQQVSSRRESDPEIRDGCRKLAGFVTQRIESLRQLETRYGSAATREPRLVRNALFRGIRVGGLGLVRDLHDLSLLANQVLLYWIELNQGFRALHDHEAESLSHDNILSVEREVSWLTTQIKQASPQALTIAPDRLVQAVTIVKKIPTSAVLPDRPRPSIIAAAGLAGAGVIGFLIGRRTS